MTVLKSNKTNLFDFELGISVLFPSRYLITKLSSLSLLDFSDFDLARSVCTETKVMCGVLLPLNSDEGVVCAGSEGLRGVDILARVQVSLLSGESLNDLSTGVHDAELGIGVMRVRVLLIIFVECTDGKLTDIPVVVSFLGDLHFEVL